MAHNCKVCIDKRVEIITPTGLKFAIAEKGKQWKNGDEIILHFLEGGRAEQDYVMTVASKLLEHANLKFAITSKPELSDIRIAFQEGRGSWSFLGTDALLIPKTDATMNFGWELDETVVIHEFFHGVAGAGHEHQNPNGNPIRWVKENILRDMPHWTVDQVDHNIVDRYKETQLIGDSYDPSSIMHYFFPLDWTEDGYAMQQNEKMSLGDIALLKKLYPKPTTKPAEPTPPVISGHLVDAKAIWPDLRSLISNRKDNYVRLAEQLNVQASSDTKSGLIKAIAQKLDLL